MRQKTKFKETEIGKIPEDWEVRSAEEFCSRVTDGTHDSPKQQKEGKYLITSRHLKGSHLDFKNAYFISNEDFTEANRRSKVDQWDVIFSMIGTIGETYLEKSNVINYAIKNVGLFKSGGNKNKGKWIFYYMKSRLAQEYIHCSRAGTTQEYMTLESLRKFPVFFPINGIEMSSVIQILDSLQDKIEINQQTNKTLEKIGQVLFKHWFVDFEFPFDFTQDKPNEEGKSYKSSGGEMVDSELGEIPKGWEAGRLGDFIDVERGLSYKGKFLVEENGLPMVNLGTMAAFSGFIYDGLKYYSGEYKERNLVRPGDIVIANTDITQKRDVLGSPAIVPADLGSDKILFTHHIYVVRKKSDLPNFFLYFLLQTKEYKERVRGFATGTTVLALPDDAILDLRFAILPGKDILSMFNSIIGQLMRKKAINNLQNRNLASIRDSLLPRLMSGRIRVGMNL